MRYKKFLYLFALSLSLLFSPFVCRAMPPGTLLYRTSGQGKMYGYSGDPLIYSEKGIIKSVYSGHAAMYIGQENGIDYIVEAAEGGIVKTPAKYFVNLAEGEKFLGAKIPKNLTPVEQAKAVAIAKSLVNKKLAYDFDFQAQKGPDSGDWTCVGLTEKIYESADMPDPDNINELVYDPKHYAVDITPDGFDDTSVVNDQGDCFSKDREFSKISRRRDLLLPAPELIGYDAGLEHDGQRYIFLPYTQFLQPTLKDVPVDITVASSFDGATVRGPVNTVGLILKWSLIDNPLSSVAVVAQKIKTLAVNAYDSLFSSGSDDGLALGDGGTVSSTATSKTSAKKTSKKTAVAKTTSKKTVTKSPVKVNKAKTIASVSGSDKQSSEPSSNTSEETLTTTNTQAKTTPAKVALLPVSPVSIVKATTTVSSNTPSSSSSGSNSSTGGSSNNVVVNNNSASTNNADNTQNSSGDNSNVATSTDNTSDDSPDATPTSTPVARLNRIYATGDNDWVEIYNPTDQAFDLATAGYRLEKTKTAEDPSLIMRIGNAADGTYPHGTMIAAHGTYLIVRDEAKAFYKDKADAIATRDDFSWTGSDYTIYLGTDAISSSTDPDIMDAVGFGSGATYYLGSGPAPKIDDNYILTRVASAGDNQTDYQLRPTDDPDAVFDSGSGNSTSTPVSDTGLYSPPTPYLSEGLVHLWHFDECYGSSTKDAISAAPANLALQGTWAVGDWGCGYQIDYKSSASAIFSQPIDSSNFSVSFRYRAAGNFPRLTLNWSGDNGYAISWMLNNGQSNFAGLPGVYGNYNFTSPFDDSWHQATIVINQAELYWSIYIDGQEEFHQAFADFMPLINSLSVTNTNGPALIDELAVWNRALSQTEILAINNADAPFSPVTNREAQAAPVLSHHWNFDEGTGAAIDNVASSSMAIPDGSWAYLGQIKHGLNPLWGKPLRADFDSLNSRDLSMAFWYKANDDPGAVDSRVHIALRQDGNELMSLTPSPHRVSYSFNSDAGILSQGDNNFLPKDNNWHHLVLTYDSFRYVLHFYVDGQEAASSSEIWFPSGVRPDNLYINEENGSVSLDELSLWQGTLSAKKVKELYDAEK